MYILSQDKKNLINFDNFHELFVDEGVIWARVFSMDKKISVKLGEYGSNEEAEKEFEDIQDSLCDENVGMHLVE